MHFNVSQPLFTLGILKTRNNFFKVIKGLLYIFYQSVITIKIKIGMKIYLLKVTTSINRMIYYKLLYIINCRTEIVVDGPFISKLLQG